MRLFVAVALIAAAISPALAQTPAPLVLPPQQPMPALPAPAPAPAPPIGPRAIPSGVEAGQSSIYLSAVFAPGDIQPVTAGLKWRVFREQPEPDGSHKLVAESSEAAPLLVLPDGGYVVHVACGLAGSARRVDLRGQSASERLVLNAGGLRVTAYLGENPVPGPRMSMSIFVPDRNNPEARLVASNVRSNTTVCLPEGNYHIVSTLSDMSGGAGAVTPSNSVVVADLRVQAAKITEASLRHRAAQMTLKLVNARGGEALANTAFTVLTPGGDVIRELIGAFPSIVLAEGEYIAIARNDGKTYQSVFQVQSTVDRDVEITANRTDAGAR